MKMFPDKYVIPRMIGKLVVFIRENEFEGIKTKQLASAKVEYVCKEVVNNSFKNEVKESWHLHLSGGLIYILKEEELKDFIIVDFNFNCTTLYDCLMGSDTEYRKERCGW